MGGSCSTHGEITNAHKHSVGKPNGKDYLAEVRQNRTVVLKLIFSTRGAGACNRFIRLVTGFSKRILVSMKGEELDQVTNCHLPQLGCPTMKTEYVTYRLLEWCSLCIPAAACSKKRRPAERAYISFESRKLFELEEDSLLDSHISNVKYDLHNAEDGYCELLQTPNLNKLYLLLLSIMYSDIQPQLTDNSVTRTLRRKLGSNTESHKTY